MEIDFFIIVNLPAKKEKISLPDIQNLVRFHKKMFLCKKKSKKVANSSNQRQNFQHYALI